MNFENPFYRVNACFAVASYIVYEACHCDRTMSCRGLWDVGTCVLQRVGRDIADFQIHMRNHCEDLCVCVCVCVCEWRGGCNMKLEKQ